MRSWWDWGSSHFQSAVLNLLANTAPVAWGAIGTPIVTLAAVSGLDQVTLSAMAGRQLPFVSVLVPFWLVATFVKMEGGTWKEAFEVWPAALVRGRLVCRSCSSTPRVPTNST